MVPLRTRVVLMRACSGLDAECGSQDLTAATRQRTDGLPGGALPPRPPEPLGAASRPDPFCGRLGVAFLGLVAALVVDRVGALDLGVGHHAFAAQADDVGEAAPAAGRVLLEELARVLDQ